MKNNTDHIYDDPTGTNLEQIEKPYQAILTAINQTYHNADEWHTYRDTVETDVSPNEIDNFMTQLNYQEFLDIKMLRVDSTKFTDEDEIAEINNHVAINPEYKASSQKVYYIKGSKNHIVLIPIRKNQNQLFIFTQLFHMSPQIIQDGRNNLNKNDISNIKFTNSKDLITKKKPNT